MAKKSLLWQLYPLYLLVTVLALVTVGWYASNAIRTFYIEATCEKLQLNAALAGEQLHKTLDKPSAHIEELAKEIAHYSGNRITVMGADGKVLADSSEDPAKMENHADRPEVQAAISGQIGRSTRYSSTLGKELLYVAVPIMDANNVVAVVRVAAPLASLAPTINQTYSRIATIGIIVAVITAILSLLIVHRITRPLARMEKAAKRFTDGELDVKVPTAGANELRSLAHTLNTMADRLKEKIDAVTAQRNELEAVLSGMVEGVLVIDADEKIVSINDAAAVMLNIGVRKSRGQAIEAVIWNTELQKMIADVLAGRVLLEQEIIINADDKRYIQAHGAVLQREAGTGAVIVLNDITRLKQLEDLRRQFVANVSHELKTPITSIKGFVETLLEGAVNEPNDAKRFLEIIAKQANRLSAIIDDLLSLSRIEQESENDQIVLTRGSINEVLNNVLTACQPRAALKEMNITLHCDADTFANINAQLLEQAVINLVDNAIKYSDPGKNIAITAKKTDDHVVISVSDRGYGIAGEHLERIFERFYVADKARSRKLGGTGLGLAIVKHIAAAHGGKVSVESTVGKGSTFTISLPTK